MLPTKALEEFDKVQISRNVVVVFTIACFVFVFVSTFFALAISWNLRNLRFAQLRHPNKLKAQLMSAAILTLLAGLFTFTVICLRLFKHTYASTLPITLVLLLLALMLIGMSVSLFIVYAKAGSLENPKKQVRFLKSVIGLSVISLACSLFVLLANTSIPTDIKKLVLQ